jgi:hypothetical protein
VVRLRTLIQYRQGTWVSITRDAFIISRATTALTIIASLKGLDPALLLERVVPGNPGTFDDTGTGISQDEYLGVISLVEQALEQEADPVQVIVYLAGAFSLRAGGGGLNPIIVEVLPNPMTTGSQVKVLGVLIADYAFSNQVLINASTASVTGVGSGSITILVPDDAISGLMTLSNGAGVATHSVAVVPPIPGAYSPRADGGGLYRTPAPDETPIPGILGGLAPGGEFRHGYGDPAHIEATRAPAPDLTGDLSPRGESSSYTGPTPQPAPPLVGQYAPFPTPSP